MNYAITVLWLTGRAPPSVTTSTQSTHLTNVYMPASLTTNSRRTNINKVHARSQLWVCRNNKCKRTQNAWHASIYTSTPTTLRKYKPACENFKENCTMPLYETSSGVQPLNVVNAIKSASPTPHHKT